jgi:hypothetical protein
MIADIRAEVTVEASVKPAAFAESFDADSPLARRWQTAGTVQVVEGGHGGSGGCLLLKRSLEALQTDTGATGPAFAVRPGPCRVQYAWKARLHSPDNSYHGSVALEVLDQAGKPVETIPVGIGFGCAGWQEVSKPVSLPRGAAEARFRVALRKTYGSFWVDELSAAPLSAPPVVQRVERVLLATDAVGNLFLPGDPVRFDVTVEAAEPLDDVQRAVRYSLRDYWGAQQVPSREVTLAEAPRRRGRCAASISAVARPRR